MNVFGQYVEVLKDLITYNLSPGSITLVGDEAWVEKDVEVSDIMIAAQEVLDEH